MFETGVDEMSWDDTVRFYIPPGSSQLTCIVQENYRMGGAFKWPKMDTVYAYRKCVCLCLIASS